MIEVLYSIQEVAALLKVSPRTVYSWVDAGYLNAIKLPSGTLRIKQSDLATFIRNNLTQDETIPQRLRRPSRSMLKQADLNSVIVSSLKHELKALQEINNLQLLKFKLSQIIHSLEILA